MSATKVSVNEFWGPSKWPVLLMYHPEPLPQGMQASPAPAAQRAKARNYKIAAIDGDGVFVEETSTTQSGKQFTGLPSRFARGGWTDEIAWPVVFTSCDDHAKAITISSRFSHQTDGPAFAFLRKGDTFPSGCSDGDSGEVGLSIDAEVQFDQHIIAIPHTEPNHGKRAFDPLDTSLPEWKSYLHEAQVRISLMVSRQGDGTSRQADGRSSGVSKT